MTPRETRRAVRLLCVAYLTLGAGIALSFGGRDTDAINLITGACLITSITLIAYSITGTWRGTVHMAAVFWLAAVVALVYRLLS